MAPIIFIAVQCFQCSTMQVKQKKKSSNKWNCAVCNEKQSITKVFAQGFMAKDIRPFVQSFNMSRKSLDEQTLPPSLPRHITNQDDDEDLPVNPTKKRSDWTEYLDPPLNHIQHTHQVDLGGGDVSEVKVVTELEKGMFKRPRLQNYSPGLGGGGSRKLFKPTFSRRITNKMINSKEGTVKSELALSENKYKEKNGGGSQRCQPAIREESCKWKEYMTEEEDSLQLGWRRGFKDYTDQGNSSVLEAITNEEMVEEDIHPDFM